RRAAYTPVPVSFRCAKPLSQATFRTLIRSAGLPEAGCLTVVISLSRRQHHIEDIQSEHVQEYQTAIMSPSGVGGSDASAYRADNICASAKGCRIPALMKSISLYNFGGDEELVRRIQ